MARKPRDVRQQKLNGRKFQASGPCSGPIATEARTSNINFRTNTRLTIGLLIVAHKTLSLRSKLYYAILGFIRR
ncbi:hypothetical protein NPIL_562541 [Nephila pilipes]|uniref:Uncharacterized protein n=1 Tax=Nephila pilipes TaxID=299642 RepID=A0A8X6NIZ3_NEPPI|nr:hypothetical protein NPIL_562541 [Nephila pilipes]